MDQRRDRTCRACTANQVPRNTKQAILNYRAAVVLTTPLSCLCSAVNMELHTLPNILRQAADLQPSPARGPARSSTQGCSRLLPWNLTRCARYTACKKAAGTISTPITALAERNVNHLLPPNTKHWSRKTKTRWLCA